jgi:hypothetical protein
MNIGTARQRRPGLAGKRQQRYSEAFQQWQQQRNFTGFTGVRQRDDQVFGGYHAQVAVAGFAGMHEKRRCAGARQGGGNLVADMSGFAHSGYHHPPLAVQNQITGARKAVVQPLHQG